ncbi:lysyl oxidase family protein [Streptomyces sp. NPDC060064]|uniref:lysyl oxidase family protein n=1 Tax=Streptomyces sp. NPDC060064 TaxID=3347049 RepID=UPI0036B01C8B
MTRHPISSGTRLRRTAAVAVALAAVAAATGAAPVAGAAPTTTAPKLKLIAAADSVTLDRYEGEPGVNLDLGTYLTVDGGPLEFKVTRPSYKKPVTAAQIIHEGKKTRTKPLPAGLVKDFSGLPGFLKVTISKASGAKVLDTTQAFCPNSAAGRIRPDAPATSKYPEECPRNPFTLGSVWGVEKGWAANTSRGRESAPADLPPGEYTAKVSVAKTYRDLFGMANEQKTIKVKVRKVTEGGGGPAASRSAHSAMAGHSAHGSGHGADHGAAASGHASHYGVDGRGADAPAPPALSHALQDRGTATHLGDGPGHTDGSRNAPALQPNAHRPTGRASVPNVPKPDLRSLPAWDIAISDGEDGDVPGKDYLAFSANVWNAGPAPLVVDGFRSPGKNLMDAYQYFYDANGKQIGYTPTGAMEWDPRVGHEHWHFKDFASYRLLSANQAEIVRSGKEAFCLANTDAIDYTVKNANWHPNNTDLSTACGEQNSVSVREVLDVGSGDTYTQYRPGQSFDVTDLPNGTYYIQVIANPEHRLQETNLKNNVALRKVVLGGKPGARTVKVPPHDLISAP